MHYNISQYIINTETTQKPMKNNDYSEGDAMTPIFQKDLRRVFAKKCVDLQPYPTMFHKNMEILYVTKGCLDFNINGTAVRIAEGDICFTFPYIIHDNDRQTAEYVLISFDPELCTPFSAELFNQVPRHPCIYRDAIPRIVPELITRSAEIYDKITHQTDSTIVGYITAIIGECLSALELFPINTANANTVQEILIYCAENYRNEISLKRIAEDLHLSPNYISSIFAKKLKISLRDYINNMRTIEATQLLTHTDKRITEIMQECGFKNQSTFNKTFLEICGVTPRQFRNRLIAEKSDKI